MSGQKEYSIFLPLHIFFLNQFTSKTDLQNEIRQLRDAYTSRGRNTAAGIRKMHLEQFSYVNGDRPGAPNVVLLITDGQSNIDNARTISDARAAKDAGINIVVLGVSNQISEGELRDLSSYPQTRGVDYFVSPSFSDSTKADVVTGLCSSIRNWSGVVVPTQGPIPGMEKIKVLHFRLLMIQIAVPCTGYHTLNLILPRFCVQHFTSN